MSVSARNIMRGLSGLSRLWLDEACPGCGSWDVDDAGVLGMKCAHCGRPRQPKARTLDPAVLGGPPRSYATMQELLSSDKLVT